jgi:hypothetical protein
MARILIIAFVALAAAGCDTVSNSDATWRGDDSYGTGQRGKLVNGGTGRVSHPHRPSPNTGGGSE